jgi:radical SAM protein with 4Fe4S-binding SPASM domain
MKANFDLNKKYIFNQNYKLRSDLTRIVITNNDSGITKSIEASSRKNEYTSGFCWFMHPHIALFLKFFNGQNVLKDVVNSISEEFDLTTEEVLNSINPFINNNETFYYHINDINSDFPIPKNCIIENNLNLKRKNILENIDINYIIQNFSNKSKRCNIPNEMSIMLNSNCYTNCIYCYVDKKKEIQKYIPLERIIEIIDEAKSLHFRDCQVMGGDLFSYQNWYEVLKHLKKNGYSPYISTKHPLDENIVSKLSDLQIDQIQISLDSTNIESLKQILKVDDMYFNKINYSLNLLKQYNINFCVKSVITKYNDNIEEISNLINYLLKFSNFVDISIAPGEYNRFSNFNAFRTSLEKFQKISDFINDLNNDKVKVQECMQPIDSSITYETKKRRFERRAACSGNLSTFLILPDGKVTLCEQTYWNNNLILGDINKNSILQVWNSEKAKTLWNISKNELNEDNPCKTCDEFETCRRGRGVCWRMAMVHYGEEKYNYPPPECPKMSTTIKDIFIK